MDTGQPKTLSCQSCGMPMEKPEDFGTGAEGYKGGRFAEPHISMEQMIDKIAGMAPMMRMTEDKAREMAKTFIPRLQRWR
ncbi:MAG: hypothetical protein HW382_1139 [Deltaproteobacteria bacterium]|nr:hypothetical protein [Deltaproteobacteria bacterium]